MNATNNCLLCRETGGEALFADAKLRVVRVDDADGDRYPGFCRVIWNAHVKEMTDLAGADRAHFMDAVFCLEAALRTALIPEKINLASLGNITPHLHWHVIPRYIGDTTFPKPIWAPPNDVSAAGQLDTLAEQQQAEVAVSKNAAWVAAVKQAFNQS
jgi:diadenosine tetraphosphate (Ap4A) HIT family hydrolase